MNKKVLYLLVALIVLLTAGAGYLFFSLDRQKRANQEMQELAELDKKEMENEYEQFARQYSEMRTQINNDSIVAQLTQEQMKTQQLLEELKRVKSSDAREIARLKKELATMRAVLKSYVMQIDSLNRLNENLTAENNRMKGEYAEATRQIEGLNSERASLSEKVAIAAQLDATGINMVPYKKENKKLKHIKDCEHIRVDFTVAKNVTAANGMRTFYVRITMPNGQLIEGGPTFNYENRSLKSTASITKEYTGEALPVQVYFHGKLAYERGTYGVSIFADGHMIGSKSFTIAK